MFHNDKYLNKWIRKHTLACNIYITTPVLFKLYIPLNSKGFSYTMNKKALEIPLTYSSQGCRFMCSELFQLVFSIFYLNVPYIKLVYHFKCAYGCKPSRIYAYMGGFYLDI